MSQAFNTIYASKEELCSKVYPVFQQKRKQAFFNIPPPRLNIVSPYPGFTQQQLDMRRKAEILRHSNVAQNTKTNNMTKKQRLAYIVNNGGAISQSQINQTRDSITTCPNAQYIPTSSTACDVPGSPITLIYDPAVPLYNFGNHVHNRTYAIENRVNYATFEFYTINTLEFLEYITYYALPDDTTLYKQTREVPLGSLIMGLNAIPTKYTFNIQTPVSLWFYSSINSGFDANGNIIVKDVLNTSDASIIRINSVSLVIYYNDTVITPAQNANVSWSFVDCIFHLNLPYTSRSTSIKQFYAIQYVGMVSINNLEMNSTQQEIFDLKISVEYTYGDYTGSVFFDPSTKTMIDRFDFFTTGVFANIESPTGDEYVYSCVMDTPSPAFENGTFIQFLQT